MRTGEEAEECLDRDLLALVVDLDLVAVEVDLALRARVDGGGEGVARVARCVVGEHEDDLRVGNAEPLDGAVPAARNTGESRLSGQFRAADCLHGEGVGHVLQDRTARVSLSCMRARRRERTR